MNANELADILQQSDFLAMDFAEEAAIMLRQQQAEIEALKDKLKTYEILEIMVTEKLRKAQEK